MIIDYIKLKNYRQYRNQTINFDDEENEKNIIVIRGANGAGKTNLLNAITFCLYGKESHLGKKYTGLPILNTLTLDKLKAKDSTTAEVEILMRSKDRKKKYEIKRTIGFLKTDDGEIEEIKDPHITKLEVFVQIGKDIKGFFKDPISAVQRIVPEQINEYFFFDGERLDDYFQEEAGGKVKNAVFKISQLELLEKMIEHLNDIGREILKSKKGTPKVKEIQEAIIAYQNSVEEMEAESKRILAAKKEALVHRKELNKKLRGTSIDEVKELAKEKDDLVSEISKIENYIKEEEENQSNYLIEIAPKIYTYDSIIEVSKIITTQEIGGEIPPYNKKLFLEKLLENGECICGIDISKKNEYRKKVEILLQSCEDITDSSTELIEMGGELRRLKDITVDFNKKVATYNKRIMDFEADHKKKNERLKKIQEKLKDSNEEEIRRTEKKLEEYDREIGKADEKLGAFNMKIEFAKEKIDQQKSELTKELKKEEHLKELYKIHSFCSESLKFASKIKKEIMEETRIEIEEKTKKYFFDIIWKKEQYKDVKIDENYNLSVVDQSGMEALGTLSAGETQALALAFIAALHKVSGFDVPLVIDTPLGRISKEPKQNIANYLPKFFENTQITLLMTEEEYTSEVRKGLSKNICKEYEIEFKEYKKGCEVEVTPYGR